MNTYRDIITNGDTSLLTMIEQAEYDHAKAVQHVIFFRAESGPPGSVYYRPDGSSYFFRPDGTSYYLRP